MNPFAVGNYLWQEFVVKSLINNDVSLLYREDGAYLPLFGYAIYGSVFLSLVMSWVVTFRAWAGKMNSNLQLALLIPGIILVLVLCGLPILMLAIWSFFTGQVLILG